MRQNYNLDATKTDIGGRKIWQLLFVNHICGYRDCSFNTIKALAPYVDEWIVDIKSMNADIYYRYTGKNSAVHQHLECAKRLLPADKVTIKVPHIPDFTIEEDVRESIRELGEMGFANIVEFDYVKQVTRITK